MPKDTENHKAPYEKVEVRGRDMLPNLKGRCRKESKLPNADKD